MSLNVTAVDPEGAGYVTVYPCGTMPLASNLNYLAGQTVPNAVIAPVSATGTVCFYSLRPADIVVDINGWFRSGGGYTPVGPQRVLDTRPEPHTKTLRFVPATKVVAGEEMEVQLSDLGTRSPVDRCGRGLAERHRRRCRAARVPLGLSVRTATVGVERQLRGRRDSRQRGDRGAVVDRVGVLLRQRDDRPRRRRERLARRRCPTSAGPALCESSTRGPARSANAMLQVTPVPLTPGTVLAVKVADLGGLVPSSGVSAVSLNVTATNVTAAGYITVFPAAQPLVSSVNYAVPQSSTANGCWCRCRRRAPMCFFSLAPVDLVVDINGWFAAP